MPEIGVFHDGPWPKVKNAHRGSLIIAGPGHTLLEDWAEVLGHKGDVMGVAAAGMFLPRMRHWYSSHGTWFPAWEAVRELNFRPVLDFYEKHASQGADNVDHRWPINGRYGRVAGLSASIVACELGYQSVVLAGIPADGRGHFYPGLEHAEDFADYGDPYHKAIWEWLRDNYFAGRVKSLSGNTRQWLGAPI